MVIYQYSTFPYGGAGTAAVRHHWEMRRQGIDSRFFYRAGLEYPAPDGSLQPIRLQAPVSRRGFLAQRRESRRRRRIIDHYERHIRNRPPELELFSQADSLEPTPPDASAGWPDIAHFHWLAFLIDYPSFFAAFPPHIPLVWTLHDMNPFTGGCHYSDGCRRFAYGCGTCPTIQQPHRSDVSFHGLRLKQAALAHRHVHVVTPSRWLKRLAEQSPVWPAETQFHHIPNGLDTSRFRPIDKSIARKQLGLPHNVTLLAFGAEDVANPRKGFHSLLLALRLLPLDQPLECIVFGRGQLPNDRAGLPMIHPMGFVDGIERQALIYSAADIFVLPSLEDNAPQTGLEAMACGTPVVAYDAGGIPEFVMPGQTGSLAATGNTAALARQIADLARHSRLRQRLGAGARRLIEAEFDVRKQVRKYIDVYQSTRDAAQVKSQREAA